MASVCKVTVVPLTLIVGAAGTEPWMVISLVPTRVVPAGAAGVPPVTDTVAVIVNVTSDVGMRFTVTTPVEPLIMAYSLVLMLHAVPLKAAALGVIAVLLLSK